MSAVCASASVPQASCAFSRRAVLLYVLAAYSGYWMMGFTTWFPSLFYQSSTYCCLTRTLFILILTTDLASEASTIFVPYLFVHVFRHLVDIYRLPVLLLFEDLSGRTWHDFPLCVCGARLPSYCGED